MIHARQLLLCTTFLLGSCVPLTPPPSVTIYNTINTRPDREIRHSQVVTCSDGGTYTLPGMPVLDDLEEGDDVGVVDRLNEHIDHLRDELKALAAKGGCKK